MKIECSVEELKLLFKNFDLKEDNKKIDGQKSNIQTRPPIKKINIFGQLI